MKKQLIVINPCAGRRHALRRLDELRMLTEAGELTSEIHQTSGAGDARDIVARRAGEFERVVCVGGDGTLNEVISGMLDSGMDVPIGYIPAGTTNDLAASHGLPGDLAKAARNVAEGEALPIDVGAFNGRCFVYTASFGAFTRASYSAPQQIKNVLGHLAYILEGVRDVTRIRPYHLAIEAGETCFEEDYIFGTFSNATSMGGVLKFDPRRVDLHDGKFELLLVRKPDHIGQLILVASALQRQTYDHELVRFVTASRVRVAADPDMPWTLDGEYQPGASEIVIENLHDAVRLIVPRHSPELQRKSV